MTKVTVEEVERRLNSGQQTTFVDSRSAHAWDEAEVKAGGAIRIPPDAVEKHIADITYCT
jgi:hypothetical protein